MREIEAAINQAPVHGERYPAHLQSRVGRKAREERADVRYRFVIAMASLGPTDITY